MSIENHTVSLDLCQRLKAAGYPQESEFYWAQPSPDQPLNEWIGGGGREHRLFHCEGHPINPDALSAPLATELLEQLPKWIRFEDRECEIVMRKSTGIKDYVWFVWWQHNTAQFHVKQNKSLPDALAEMWLWLKQEGHL